METTGMQSAGWNLFFKVSYMFLKDFDAKMMQN